MIQDIFPKKYHNEYRPDAVPGAGSVVFCFHREDRRKVLAFSGGADKGCLRFPLWEELTDEVKESGSFFFLFNIDGRYFFRLDVPKLAAASEDPAFYCQSGIHFTAGECPADATPGWYTLRELRSLHPGEKELIFALFTAFPLEDWYRDNRFCGTCGTPAVHSAAERAMVCPSCGRKIYPRIMPAVIVAVTDGDRVILTRYADRNVRFYSLIAGFTEIGETLEETVAREVMEEVGLTVKNIRYYKSQPWGIANDILAGFYCDVCGSREIRMDTNELKEAAWFTREEIDAQDDDFSLTNEMMIRFKEGLV